MLGWVFKVGSIQKMLYIAKASVLVQFKKIDFIEVLQLMLQDYFLK